MLPENELLQYIHKTADMGCVGIEAVQPYARDAGLKKILNSQLTEYQKLRKQAQSQLRKRGERIGNVGPMAKLSARMMAAGKLMLGKSDSRIVEMTIQGNNMGVNKTLKHLHDYAGRDQAVRDLTEKLLETEERNAKQLKPFL